MFVCGYIILSVFTLHILIEIKNPAFGVVKMKRRPSALGNLASHHKSERKNGNINFHRKSDWKGKEMYNSRLIWTKVILQEYSNDNLFQIHTGKTN